jgi:hypothetical protein
MDKEKGTVAPVAPVVRRTTFRIDFLIREVCDDGSVPEEDLRHIKFGEDLRQSQMFDAFNRYRDAVGLMFPNQGPMVLAFASVGGNKIQVIKAMREITDLGLKEAKDLVEAPCGTAMMVFSDLTLAELAAKRFADAGAQVRLRSQEADDLNHRPGGLVPLCKVSKFRVP